MNREQILRNVQSLRAQLAQNAMDPENPPMLLPVTKTRTVEEIIALRDAGIAVVGENRVQELMEKHRALCGDFAFDLIGRLQTNKIKYIIDRVRMLHALDRLSLAQALDGRMQAAGGCMPVLIEVNIGGEAQKAGIAPRELEAFARVCAKMPGLCVKGLMTVMPVAEDPQTLRPLFRQMREAFERLRELGIEGTSITELSMGMSGDWQIAAQEGATIVRIGSAIFGQRPAAGTHP